MDAMKGRGSLQGSQEQKRFRLKTVWFALALCLSLVLDSQPGLAQEPTPQVEGSESSATDQERVNQTPPNDLSPEEPATTPDEEPAAKNSPDPQSQAEAKPVPEEPPAEVTEEEAPAESSPEESVTSEEEPASAMDTQPAPNKSFKDKAEPQPSYNVVRRKKKPQPQHKTIKMSALMKAHRRCSEIDRTDTKHRGPNCWGDDRIALSSTAYGLKQGETTMVGLYGVGWAINHGLTDNLELTILANLPVGAMGVLPGLRFHTDRDKPTAWAIGAHAGLGSVFTNTDVFLWNAGFDTELSRRIGSRHFINLELSFNISAIQHVADSQGDYSEEFMLTMLALGYRVAFAKHWSFALEYHLPFWTQFHQDARSPRENIFGFFVYGFRGHGKILFGDVGLFIPTGTVYTNALVSYVPLGIPYASIGVHF